MGKAVINSCYGRFELSDKAIKRYYQKIHPELTLYFYTRSGMFSGNLEEYKKQDPDSQEYTSKGLYRSVILTKDYGDVIKASWTSHPWDSTEVIDIDLDSLKRHDPVLLEAIEEVGLEASSGIYSNLKIIEFPGNLYRISEYDGYETLETPDTIKWINIEENGNT